MGRTIRTTAKQDIRSVFQDTTQKILGRNVSADEIEKFVRAYERMEISEATGGVRAPNIGVAAEQQVQQQFGPEAEAVGALGLFDILDKKIKGLA
jgi:O-phosphoseryl-tRNA(Cys) synthetase